MEMKLNEALEKLKKAGALVENEKVFDLSDEEMKPFEFYLHRATDEACWKVAHQIMEEMKYPETEENKIAAYNAVKHLFVKLYSE